MFSSIRSTVISFVTIFELIWRQQELYQQLSKFHQRIETYELINKQLNDTIVDLKAPIKFLATITSTILYLDSRKFISYSKFCNY